MDNGLKEVTRSSRNINWEKQGVVVFPPGDGDMTRMVTEELKKIVPG